MKTIRITKDVKRELDKFADGKSINKAMRELLNSAEIVEDVAECEKEYANIHIDDDLLEKLNRCKKCKNESQSEVIARLLSNK
ncbi:hypothetical protein [Methanobrevibacter sp.]|uniref:hypothetical protein n=1 Tax=Methanobrevibacter sp. TaxID=66852 RepID=UPI00386318BB